MPSVGSFHAKYWKARNNAVAPPGVSSTWGYPRWQSVPRSGVTLSMAIWGVPLDALRPLWQRLTETWRFCRQFWRFTRTQREALDRALAKITAHESFLVTVPIQVEVPKIVAERVTVHVPAVPDAYRATVDAVLQCDAVQRQVLDQAIAVMRSSWWPDAQAAVAAVAHSPKFHQAEQWVEYGRALKANAGQAQNVFRHIKAVAALRSLADGPAAISNPDAHLIVELAYRAYTVVDPRPKQIISHPRIH